MPDDIPPPPRNFRAAPSYRPERARGRLDPGTRNLLIAAAGVFVLLLLLVGGWALGGRRAGGIPVIHADTQPLRIKPTNPGGMQIAGANEQMLNDTAGQTATMTPTAEAPAPQALRAQLPPPPAPAAVAPPPSLAASAPVAAPAIPAAVPAPIAAPAPAATDSAATVQLAALATDTAAHTEWERLQKRMPDLLGGKHPVFERAEHDGKPVWRLRLGGFVNVAAATHFCAELRAKGSACQLATF